MKNFIITSIIFLISWCNVAIASEDITIIKQSIEKGYYQNNLQELEKQKEIILNLLAKDNNNWHLLYYAGFIYNHLGRELVADNKNLSKKYLNEAIATLKKALKIKKSGDLYALLATTYGIKIHNSTFMEMMSLGEQSRINMDNAYAINTVNPKVDLLNGASKLYTPTMFGGGVTKARKLLLNSLRLSKTYIEHDNLMINWGGPAEILAKLAELEISEKNTDVAAHYIKESLKIKPDYFFVNKKLIPKLNAISK